MKFGGRAPARKSIQPSLESESIPGRRIFKPAQANPLISESRMSGLKAGKHFDSRHQAY